MNHLSIIVSSLVITMTCGLSIRATTIWDIGTYNNLTSDFEHEADADDLFYRDAGDYTSTMGYNVGSGLFDLPGVNRSAVEPWIDAASITEGFERAVTVGDPAINIYHQLLPSGATPGSRYELYLDIQGHGGGGSSNADVYMNGTLMGAASSLTGGSGLRFIADGSAVAGPNVLSIVRSGGAGFSSFDGLKLRRIADDAVFQIGFDNNTAGEFEQEGGGRNDANFYADAGDYTSVSGLNGVGVNRAEFEHYADPNGSEGFARALTLGVPTSNIFFQLNADQAAGRLRYKSDLIGLGGGSSHDLNFMVNGQVFHSLSGVTSATPIDIEFDGSTVNAVAGGNVLSIQRVGGSGTSPWIQFDYVDLYATVPEPGTFGLFLAGAFALARYRRTP